MSKSRKLLAFPLVLSTLVAGAAGTYTPIACSCVDPWVSLAAFIDRDDIDSSFGLTPRVVADGLAKKLSGSVVGLDDLSFAETPYDCAVATSPQRTLRCRLWLWERRDAGGPDHKGYDIVISTTPAGKFSRVDVIPIHHGSGGGA